MTATIYHNPACGTSRTVLAALRSAGLEVQVIEYLKTRHHHGSRGAYGGPAP